MMINEYLAKVRHAELLAEAERNHRFALAENKQSGNISSGARLLVLLGACSAGGALRSKNVSRLRHPSTTHELRIMDRKYTLWLRIHS